MTRRSTDPTPFPADHRQPADSTAVPSARQALGTVWATGQADLPTQLAERGYQPDTARVDPHLMRPAIAAHAIATLTRPADLVFDPDCGAGTTLVEALHAGRHTIGLTGTRRSWHLARANVSAVKAAGSPVDGMVLVLDRRPTTLATAHLAGFTGRVDLILTTLRPVTHQPGPAALADAVERLRTLLADSRALVRPGGHVVVTVAPYRHPDRPSEVLDLPSQVITAGISAGLFPLARCIALTAAVHGRRVRPWTTRVQRKLAARMQRSIGHPMALSAHHTALVFGVAPVADDAALSMPIPPLPTRPRRHGGRAAAA